MFDVVDRETRMTVDPAGGVADRVATSEYFPSGDMSRRVKSNGVEETWFFANDGRALRDRRQGSGAMAKDQEYRYDANGNRAKDERGEHAFNARDQLVEWKRGELYTLPGSKVTYDVNGSGAVTEERDEGASETTRYAFDGDRLMSSTVNSGTPSKYSYDSFGSVKKITGGPDAAEFAYDEFERMTMSSGDVGGAGPKTSTYEYDGMDRRDTETTQGTTQDFAYVGTTDQLSQERGRTGGKSEEYDYDSTEQLVGRAVGQDGVESQGSYKEYGIDANGSVEGLEESDGVIKPGNQYQYDPYGKIENEAQIEQAGGPGKANPFRFEAFYYDSGVKQYDMRARSYRPEIGRFTSQDRFESASRDFNLQADPLTQNRYAFAGGNPVNRVEFDGHEFGLDDVADAAEDFGEGVYESGKETVEAAKDPEGTAKGLAKAGESFVKDPVGSTKKAASAAAKCFEDNPAKCAGKTAAGLIGGKGVGAAAKGARAAAKGAKAGKAGGGTKSPGNRAATDCNSFVRGTPVLMADGSTKAIEDVRVGDLVLATVQMTGQTAVFPVTELIEGLGEKHLIRITADGKTTVATLRHPYYLPDEQRWIPAGSLSVGDRLQRPDGSTVVVEAVRQSTVLRTRVHNLTIATAHTYYAGAEPLLVHNDKDCGDSDGVVYERTDRSGGKPYIGQSKSDKRYRARQREHANANPDSDFEFTEKQRARPGEDLDVAEQDHIDRGGGPTTRRNPSGGLANKRNQMSKERHERAKKKRR